MRVTMLSFNGQEFSQAEWGRRLGMSGQLISKRLAKGWPIDRVLATDLPRYPRKRGSESPMWKGGRVCMDRAVRSKPGQYVGIFAPNHPKASVNGYVREHVLVAERALGKPLPESAAVHHVDENPANNSNTNLVICQDAKYHKLLHSRMRTRKLGGNPVTDKICGACKSPKLKSEFSALKRSCDGLYPYCKSCSGTRCHLSYERRRGRLK